MNNIKFILVISILAISAFISIKAYFPTRSESFSEVLVADFPQTAPGFAAEPGGDFHGLTIAVGVLVVGGHRKYGHRFPGWGIAHLRVTPQMTNEGVFVVLLGHWLLLLNLVFGMLQSFTHSRIQR